MRYYTKYPLPPMAVRAVQYDGLNGDSIRRLYGLNIKMLNVVGTWYVRLDSGNVVIFTPEEFNKRFQRSGREFNHMPNKAKAKSRL